MIRSSCQTALGMGDQSEQFCLAPLDKRDELEQLFGFPAFTDQNEHIVAPQNPQIAMQKIDRRERKRPRSRRNERRCNLFGNQTALSYARKNNHSLALQTIFQKAFSALKIEMIPKVM